MHGEAAAVSEAGPAGQASEAISAAGAPIVKSPSTLVWQDEAATQLFARALATQPALRNACVELHGSLGAGKTTFVRHLLRALGVQGLIKSPTYAVVEPYDLVLQTPVGDAAASPLANPSAAPLAAQWVQAPTPLNIWHFDFYRFNDPREWEDAGFRDIFASPGLKIAEWPENAASHLPIADLVICIDAQADESRRVSLAAQTAVGASLLGAAAVSPASAISKAPIPAPNNAALGRPA